MLKKNRRMMRERDVESKKEEIEDSEIWDL